MDSVLPRLVVTEQDGDDDTDRGVDDAGAVEALVGAAPRGIAGAAAVGLFRRDDAPKDVTLVEAQFEGLVLGMRGQE